MTRLLGKGEYVGQKFKVQQATVEETGSSQGSQSRYGVVVPFIPCQCMILTTIFYGNVFAIAIISSSVRLLNLADREFYVAHKDDINATRMASKEFFTPPGR